MLYKVVPNNKAYTRNCNAVWCIIRASTCDHHSTFINYLMLGIIDLHKEFSTEYILQLSNPYSVTLFSLSLLIFQGLIRHFRPELEERMKKFHEQKQAAAARQ